MGSPSRHRHSLLRVEHAQAGYAPCKFSEYTGYSSLYASIFRIWRDNSVQFVKKSPLARASGDFYNGKWGQNWTVPRLRSTSNPSTALSWNFPAFFARNFSVKSTGAPSSSKKLLPRFTKVGSNSFVPLVCRRS